MTPTSLCGPPGWRLGLYQLLDTAGHPMRQPRLPARGSCSRSIRLETAR